MSDITVGFHCDVTMEFSFVSTDALVAHFLTKTRLVRNARRNVHAVSQSMASQAKSVPSISDTQGVTSPFESVPKNYYIMGLSNPCHIDGSSWIIWENSLLLYFSWYQFENQKIHAWLNHFVPNNTNSRGSSNPLDSLCLAT